MQLPFAWSRALVTAALTLGAGGAIAAPPGSGLVASADATLRAHLGPDVRISWDDAWQAPRRITGLAVPTRGADAGARALGFLAATRKDFAAGDSRWQVERVQPLPGGGSAVRCAVFLGELPVEGHEVVVQLDAAQRVVRVTRDPGPTTRPTTPVLVSREAAPELVRARYQVAAVGGASEVILATAPGNARIAWRVPATRLPMTEHYFVWIDAETGATLRVGPAGFDEPTPGLTLRQEGPR